MRTKLIFAKITFYSKNCVQLELIELVQAKFQDCVASSFSPKQEFYQKYEKLQKSIKNKC